MGSLTYLERARDAGLSVGTEAGRLILRGPPAAGPVARLLIEHKAEVLAELGAPPPSPTPDWPALAEQRWGPALEDDTPGLVVDRPDPDRMMAALEAAALDPDRYEVEERAAIRAEPAAADPPDRLVGPYRTPWGTVCWSDPSGPAIEAFGESS